MKRTRRQKYLQISVFFLIYSILHVVSQSNGEDEAKETTKSDSEKTKLHSSVHQNIVNVLDKHIDSSDAESPTGTNKSPEKVSNSSPIHVNSSAHQHITDMFKQHTAHSSGKAPEITPSYKAHEHILSTLHHNTAHSAGKSENNSGSKETGTAKGTENEKTPAHQHIIDTVVGHTHLLIEGIKNNETNETDECTPPAIKQFPHPIMGPAARKHGGLIIHILVAIYMFLGLAIVCDEYFVASLDRICEEMKMSPDVAGATFMAAGSSAPELATVIIGVFLAKDDIGISGVIGSAVFNIMFVIACCGLCSTAVVYLNWWPLIRDCFFYAVSILVMLIVIFDKKISWLESLMMLITYLIYCIVLHYNTPLERWAQTWPVPFKNMAPTEQSGLVSYKTLEDGNKHQSYGMEQTHTQGYDMEQTQNVQPPEYSDQGMNNFGMAWSPEKYQDSFANQLSGPDLNQATTDPIPNAPAPPPPSRPAQPDYYRPKEYDPAAHVNPLDKPENGSLFTLSVWALIYPIHWLCRKTMPDCRSEKYKNWYPFTFFVSMVWISFYSYFMVWMITIIGYTMGIADTVMGLTFVAAGVSVPDALSSVAVIKEGYGDMAVSNAVGSNVFDILICLGLPWFIKTAIIKPGSTVSVISKGLTYSTLSLLSTVVFLVVAIHMNGWKLDRRFGIMLMVWYLIFITFASMYELNIFGYMNPPECPTDW